MFEIDASLQLESQCFVHKFDPYCAKMPNSNPCYKLYKLNELISISTQNLYYSIGFHLLESILCGAKTRERRQWLAK
jgi:hypothetical protein